MKRIRKCAYILGLISLSGLFVEAFICGSAVKWGIFITVALIWLLFWARMEQLLIKPCKKECQEDYPVVLKKLIAGEIMEGDRNYIDKLYKKLDSYIQNEIFAMNREIYKKNAEYSALQSQINPHFLYNTLETIRSQAISDGNREIAEMVKRLSLIFRYSIGQKGDLVTLRDELNNIRNYMKIMRFRFYDRFTLEINVEEEQEQIYDYYVPRLILQPIVENAINHGLDEMVSGGIVGIEVALMDDLIITVSDNGRGMTLHDLDALNAKMRSGPSHEQQDMMSRARGQSGAVAENVSERKGSGIALANINQRIQLLYGKKYGICIYSSENCGTDVELTLPVIDKKGNDPGEK